MLIILLKRAVSKILSKLAIRLQLRLLSLHEIRQLDTFIYIQNKYSLPCEIFSNVKFTSNFDLNIQILLFAWG